MLTLGLGNWTQVRLLPCLVSHSLTPLVEFVKIGFVKVIRWMCLNLFIVFSDFLHGFVKIDTWSSLICYLDLSKLIHGLLWFVTCICQNWYKDFSNFFTWHCQNWYIDFSKLIRGFLKNARQFVKVAKRICQSCSTYFLPFAKQNQAEDLKAC